MLYTVHVVVSLVLEWEGFLHRHNSQMTVKHNPSVLHLVKVLFDGPFELDELVELSVVLWIDANVFILAPLAVVIVVNYDGR